MLYQGRSLVGLKMFHGYLRCYHWQKLADDTQELSVLFSQILVNLKLFKDKRFFFFLMGMGFKVMFVAAWLVSIKPGSNLNSDLINKRLVTL